MIRYILTILSVALFFKSAIAQKKDTVVYYFNSMGNVVKSKEKAYYLIKVIPPDKNVDKNLFIIKASYVNGSVMFNAYSLSKDDLVFNGKYVGFYPNGHTMVEKTYNNNVVVGDITTYYPNGKVYSKTTLTPEGNTYLSSYADSTGRVLAVNGTGKWVQFSDDFNAIEAEGPVSNGLQEGEWHGKIGRVNFVWQYSSGVITSSTNDDKSIEVYTMVSNMPVFPGGSGSFDKFLRANIRYPQKAKENNTEGKVIVSFIVETTGKLSDVKVEHGIGDGCDQEAIRVMMFSPIWKPGIQNGNPARVAFSTPITFTLNK